MTPTRTSVHPGAEHRPTPPPHQRREVTATSARLATPHVVAVVVVPGTPIDQLALPSQVFGADHSALITNDDMPASWYELRMCAALQGRTPAGPDFWVDTPHGMDALAIADTVIIPAGPTRPHRPTPVSLRALHDAHARGARIVAIGSGTFLLAEIGLLNERRATTHWTLTEELGRRHPDVQVTPAVLYVRDGMIFTCAGGAATLDLYLELVCHDHGMAAVNALARHLLTAPRRAGDQTQLVASPVPDDDFARMLDWARARLDHPLTLADLSRAAKTSPRSLARRFQATLATSPRQWLITQRIQLAQQLLETTEEPVSRIAQLTGMGSPINLREQFVKATGTSPQSYRRTARRSVRYPS